MRIKGFNSERVQKRYKELKKMSKDRLVDIVGRYYSVYVVSDDYSKTDMIYDILEVEFGKE